MAKLLTLCISAFLFSAVGCQAPQERSPATPVVKHMDVNGVSLEYVEQGQGPPVVFVHGSNADYRIWEPQRDVVAQHYHFISVTQRYFGTDPWPDNGGKFSIATHADDLAAFIRELKVGPANLVGWSYGGTVLFALAVRYPEMVNSLFIFESGLTTMVSDPADIKAVGEDRRDMVGAAVAATKAGDNAKAVRVFMDAVNGQAGTFDALSPSVRSIMLDNARMLPLLFGAPPPPPISCGQLGQTKVPVTIVRGEFARPWFKIASDTSSRCIPGSRLIIAPKARHLWPGQDPSAFNEALLGFLKSN